MNKNEEPEPDETETEELYITYEMVCAGASVLMENRDSCDAYSLARMIYIAWSLKQESDATSSA